MRDTHHSLQPSTYIRKSLDSKIKRKVCFVFFAEDEIFQLRESYRGIIEKECEITRKQVEESKQQVVMELELQKQMAEDKVIIFT